MTTTSLSPRLVSRSHKAAFDLHGETIPTAGGHAVLLVSVGADYHEGEKLGATIDLVNRSEFGSVTVVVADTLQRHNVLADTHVERRRRSDGDGRRWVERNGDALARIESDSRIVHWDEVLASVRYQRWYDHVRDAYDHDRRYRESIDSTIDRFLDRRSDLDPAERARLRDGSLTYLLEECPAIMPLWADEGFDFVIYPQRISEAMSHTRSLFVEPGLSDKVRWLPLRFKKRKSARPSTSPR